MSNLFLKKYCRVIIFLEIKFLPTIVPILWVPVADPGFPRGGANFRGRCTNLLFCKFFVQNCMKMKEFGPRGGAGASLARPWIRHWVPNTKEFMFPHQRTSRDYPREKTDHIQLTFKLFQNILINGVRNGQTTQRLQDVCFLTALNFATSRLKANTP